MAIIRLGNNNYQGLSSDTKPTNVPDGALFYESDTHNFWDRISGAWSERSIVNIDTKYHIYKVSSSLYKALNTETGLVQFTSTTPDVGALTNSCIGAMSLGGKIKYSNDALLSNTKISIPANQTGHQARPYILEGQADSTSSLLGTTFRIDTAFTDGNFLIESIAAGGSGFTQNLHIKNINFYNPYGKGADGNNINGGASPRIDAGFVNIESDTHSSIAGCPFSIENCHIRYAHKGIRCAGYLWFGKLWNIGFSGPSSRFLGNYNLQFENGTGHADMPKLFNIQKISTMQTGAGGNGGSLNRSISIGGGYHHIAHIFIDFGTYNDYVFGLTQCFSSSIYDVKTIDLVNNETGEATCLIDNTSADGVASSGNYASQNIWMRDCVFQPVASAPSLKFKNGAWRNEVSMAGYWGGAATISDAGAGVHNVVEILHGHASAASTPTKITSTNSLVKIIDKRVGSSNRGIKTLSGDASNKVFNIPHGCFTTPVDYDARPITADAFGTYDLSADGTNIIVTYKIAPPGNTNNLKWKWSAEVYA